MKKTLFVLCFALISFAASAQWTVSYHQSNLPFAAVNYQIGQRFVPEFRVGTDNFFTDLDVELVANVLIVKKESFQFYGGAGPRLGDFSGIVVPFGMNIFPFSEKSFGFHMELAPIIGEVDILRGSFGLRYRFLKN
ncbi:hypothetical protein [Algoriphagus namhaensis]